MAWRRRQARLDRSTPSMLRAARMRIAGVLEHMAADHQIERLFAQRRHKRLGRAADVEHPVDIGCRRAGRCRRTRYRWRIAWRAGRASCARCDRTPSGREPTCRTRGVRLPTDLGHAIEQQFDFARHARADDAQLALGVASGARAGAALIRARPRYACAAARARRARSSARYRRCATGR